MRAGTLAAHPTYFETMTAAAFWHFRAARVEVAVLEVGLGGRLDATNVAEPLVSAVVSLDFDHEAFLGTTLDAIAREKAGVMRAGPRGRARSRARRGARGAPRRGPAQGSAGGRGPRGRARHGASGRTSSRWRPTLTPGRGCRPLPGAHQRDNLLVALRVLEEARRRGPAASTSPEPREASRGCAGRGACSGSRAGRPCCSTAPTTPRARAPSPRTCAPAGPFVLLFGVDGRQGRPRPRGRAVPPGRARSCSRGRAEARAATPEEIARRTTGLARRLHREADVKRALALARKRARPGETVVVAGSLYLVGAVLSLRGRGSDRAASGRSQSAGPR